MTTASQQKKRVSRQGLELVKSFEGLRRRAARLPNGRFVVGYGHIRSAREGAEITPEDAESLLRYDLLPIEAAINEWALAPLTQNQFDALVSLAFNIGLSSFRRSDVLRRINEGDMLRAAAALDTWRRVDLEGEPVIVDALVRRRAVEKALFLTPPAGQVPAPSAVLKPLIDTAAYGSVLLRRPEEVETPLDGDEAVAMRGAPFSEPEFAPEADAEPELAFDAPDEPEVPDAPDSPDEPEAPADPDGEVDLIVEETTLVIPPGPDPELEPGLVITETTVTLTTEADEDEAYGDETDELDFTPEAALDLDAPSDADAEAEVESDADEAVEPDAPAADPTAPASDEDSEEEPEEELSAAQAAAAAVFARLTEILAQDTDDDQDEAPGSDLSALTLDPEPETADGDFLQAPPAPPFEPAGFPQMDEASLAAFDAETPRSDLEFAPESDPDLAPFPDDGVLPPVIEPEEQAEFDSAYIDEAELDTGEPSVAAPPGEDWDQRSGVQPSQGDPDALAQPLEENDRAGLLIFLALTGLALVIGGLVSFARPGADESGSGWTWLLGTAGVLLIAIAAYRATAPKDGDADPEA